SEVHIVKGTDSFHGQRGYLQRSERSVTVAKPNSNAVEGLHDNVRKPVVIEIRSNRVHAEGIAVHELFLRRHKQRKGKGAIAAAQANGDVRPCKAVEIDEGIGVDLSDNYCLFVAVEMSGGHNLTV